MKSRIPELMDDATLKLHRWKTELRTPKSVPLSSNSTKIHIGSCSHTFSDGDSRINLAPIEQVVWGYGTEETGISSPGPTLVAQADQTTQVTWVNDFAWKKDNNFPFVEAPPDLRAGGMMRGRYSNSHHVVHLHGAHVPWEFDGHPVRDPHFTKQPVIRPKDSLTCIYPNTQPGGAMLWYHDHTMDATSRNVYAGLAGGYLLRHPSEGRLDAIFSENGVIREVPLILQDRSFLKEPVDGKWLFYGDASISKTKTRIDIKPRFNNQDDWPSPEFKGTVMCVNGIITPKMVVKPAPYRFRVLNGCNSRMLVLAVSMLEDGANIADNIKIYQIGSDGGLFAQPVRLDAFKNEQSNGVTTSIGGKLILAPGERADLVIDFSGVRPGDAVEYYLTNYADGNSTGTGNRGDKSFPNVLKFEVSGIATSGVASQLQVSGTAASGVESQLQEALAEIAPVVPNTVPAPALLVATSPNRHYLLKEINPINLPYQQLEPNPDPLLANIPIRFPDRSWIAVIFENIITPQSVTGIPPSATNQLWGGSAPSENVTGSLPSGGPNLESIDKPGDKDYAPILIGKTYIWDIYNFSPDTHPIHLHQAQFEIIGRRDSNIPEFTAPDLNERGWKDTIRVNRHSKPAAKPPEPNAPGGVTRIRIKFLGAAPGDSKSYSYHGSYVMHCHILEHEDMGMMRPLVIHP